MTKALPLSIIQYGLQDKKLYHVARVSGVSYPTLKKILDDGENANVTSSVCKKVSHYLISAMPGIVGMKVPPVLNETKVVVPEDIL